MLTKTMKIPNVLDEIETKKNNDYYNTWGIMKK